MSPRTRCHKTVFVLDHTPVFMRSSNQSIDYDILGKSKTPGVIPAAPIFKSLWTCSVETMMEYIRVVYDIYPAHKLVKVVAGESTLNSWSEKEQNMQHLMNALATLGPPTSSSDSNIAGTLTQAVGELCHSSELQDKLRAQNSDDTVENKGRIICLTQAKNEGHLRMLEECAQGAIEQHNALAADTEGLLPITHCELIIIHITPVDEGSRVQDKARHELSPLLTSEVVTTASGRDQYNKLLGMVYEHYSLTSTTVTGIPMKTLLMCKLIWSYIVSKKTLFISTKHKVLKEEQNASSSANYDVELLHPVEAHEELLKSAAGDGLMIQSKEGLPINTITLKWCTPKSNIQDLPACTGAFRITPVDVNSRPSSCLTNFLLSGRAVMLEQPRKTGIKVMSHMLTSHGGEIFIHTIPTCRSILEDPPSISEGPGGRVTDYRIPDYREFMKEGRLAPASPAVAELAPQLPITKAMQYLERTSRYWPMVISDTIIFNMASHIDPLPSLIVKERLTEDDVVECKKAVYHVVGLETRNEPLPVNITGARGKGSKREQQYAQMWSELESMVRAHADTSPMHQKVLECILECKKPSDDAKSRKTDKSGGKEETSDAESAWKSLDRFQRMTEQDKKEFNRMDSLDEFGPPSKRLRPGFTEPLVRTGGKQNLMSMWTSRMKSVHSKRHVEFIGRQENQGTIAQLYQHMFEDEEMDDIPVSMKK